MKINEFLKPYKPVRNFADRCLGSKFSFKDKITEGSFCVVGLSKLDGSVSHLDRLRDQLYELAVINSATQFIDLGNIISKSNKDREDAIHVLFDFVKTKNLVILLLSSEVLDLKLYEGFYSTKNPKILNISAHLDYDNFLKKETASISPNSISFIGIQTCFAPIDNINNKSIQDIVKLGTLRDDIMDIEPYFRMSGVTCFDLTSIRNSDFSKSYKNSPNGLYAEEMCQLAWFAGNSNSNYGYVVNNIPESNSSFADIMMAAQVLWYILTGLAKRYREYPGENTRNFKEYYIEYNKMPEDIVFYKSMISDKFWVKYGADESFYPCSKKDMEIVLEGNISERLLKILTVNQKK